MTTIVEKRLKLLGSGVVGEEFIESLDEGTVEDFHLVVGQLWVSLRIVDNLPGGSAAAGVIVMLGVSREGMEVSRNCVWWACGMGCGFGI